MRFRPVLAGAVILAAGAATATAQRSLHWSSLDVQARLDAGGHLHVKESLAYVFTGDWSGGERRFDLRGGQTLHLESIARADRPTGELVPLVRGGLDTVDHYDWAGRNTLRWRSRLPDDPPFDRTEIVYVFDYVLSDILLGTEDGYLLDHDFSIPARQGIIQRFSLALELDPEWLPLDEFPGRWQRDSMVPGESFVLTTPLRFSGTGEPGVWRSIAPRSLRYPLFAGLIGVFLVGSAILWRRERALGRFAPLLPIARIDESWLAEHVLSRRPEVVGAAWDNTTSAPEVAAVLARLVQEGKLASRVEREGMGIFSTRVLHLELLVDRDQLEDYERTLIDALFFAGDITDTRQIRDHYKSSGFDPAGKIKAPLRKRVKALVTDRRTAKTPRLKIAVGLLFFAGVASLIAAAVRSPADAPVALGGLLACLVLSAPAGGLATASRSRVVHPALAAIPFHIPLLAIIGGVGALLVVKPVLVGTLTLTGLAGVAAAFTVMVLHTARSGEGPERIALRKRLAAARAYFKAELAKPAPRLRDEWFPYLLAFGLGHHVDHWFRAFGDAAAGAVGAHGAAGGLGRGSSSAFTGGGGAFGGGGASGMWASAAGSLARGVTAPGSSGGGGGGGGGGSSGGGGAGGW